MPVQSKKVHGCKSRNTASSELAKLTRHAKMTKRQFRHEKGGSCEMEEQEEVSNRGRTIQSRMVNWTVFQKCWSVRCECGLREKLYLKTPTKEAALPSAPCSLSVQRSQQAQWTRGVSMRKQWMRDADILKRTTKKTSFETMLAEQGGLIMTDHQYKNGQMS